MARKEIPADINRLRVAESQKNVDRLTVTLDKGTIDRIKALNFKASAFARTVIMKELETLESISRNNVN